MEQFVCTTIEQSKALLDAGLDIESADMYYRYDYNEHTCENSVPKILEVSVWDDPNCKDIPAWSVGKLINLMPDTMYGPYPPDHSTDLMINNKVVNYFDWTGMQHGPDFTGGSLRDNCVETIKWLLKNEII